MLILGIDPGLTRCGYAALDAPGASTVRPVALGVVRTSPSSPLPARLAELRAELAALIAELRPDVVAVEHVFFQVNVRTAMSVGQASGLALAEAAAAGCDVVQYTPNQVKEAVAGWGGAGKAQVQRMVQVRLGLSAPPKPADAADAAALALCHLAMAPLRDRVAKARRRPRPPVLLSERDVIGSLRGTVLERSSDGQVLLEVGGVGYLVSVTPRTLAELEPTTGAFLHVHHHIREDAQTLYGFLSRDERATFEVLIATHGVGPGAGAGHPRHPQPRGPGGHRRLGGPGLALPRPGRREEDGRASPGRAAQPALGAGARPTPRPASLAPSAVADVREALAGLGYGPEEVREALRQVGPSDHAEALLRDALAVLGARRA